LRIHQERAIAYQTAAKALEMEGIRPPSSKFGSYVAQIAGFPVLSTKNHAVRRAKEPS